MAARHLLVLLILMAVWRIFHIKFFAKADTFASLAQMEQIVSLEIELGESLRRFVSSERKRLEKIKDFAEGVREAIDEFKTAGLKVLENPIVTYSTIKRFAYGWTELDNFLRKDNPKGNM